MQAQTILRLLVLLLSSMLVIHAADDTIEYYIDPNGSDSGGDGSDNSPFQTLAGAFAAFNIYAPEASSPVYYLYIRVFPGTYSGPQNVGLAYPSINLTISGETEKTEDVTFLCDDITPTAFAVTSGSFELSYLTISACQTAVSVAYNGNQTYQDVDIDHVAFTSMNETSVYIASPSSVSVVYSTFGAITAIDQNYASVYVKGTFLGGVDVLFNTFTDCSGVYISNMKGGNLGNNQFTNTFGDSSTAPAAFYIVGGVFDINGNTFTNVTSNYDDSPVSLQENANTDVYDRFSLDSNTFTSCSSLQWSGGAVEFYKVLGEITNSKFENNFAVRTGGAVYVLNANVTVEKSTFTNNVAQNLSGGAIDVEGDSILFLYDNTFSGNTGKGAPNSLACCDLFRPTDGECTAAVMVNDKSQGQFNSTACSVISYVSTEEYFPSFSYPYQPGNEPSGSSLWWLWLLIATFTIVLVIAVGVLVGVAIAYKKNLIFKRGYETFTE